LYPVGQPSDFQPDTDALLSLGGDGTFLSAASLAAPAGVPVLGVNFGRLGFLSESDPDAILEALDSGDYTVEERELLQVCCDALPSGENRSFALNEMSVSRMGASMLGVEVEVDGAALPTYWADGLLVATSSGRLRISLHSRDDRAVLTIDNRNYTVPADCRIEICAAPVRLKRLRPGHSNFINALRSRLLWGEDVRNGSDPE
jgi:NAD+ kinase